MGFFSPHAKRMNNQIKMSDIIMLVFMASLANANEWSEIQIFGKEHESFLRQYLELPNGIPSHDTVQRVFAMLCPDYCKASGSAGMNY